jgi:hypothetical protein
MTKIDTFKLIEGEFSTEEAREIILSLIQYKIQFHSIKILSNEERFGTKDTHSMERLSELRETLKDIKTSMDAIGDKKLVIRSNITIEIAE